jgi:hypothetical protein
MKAHELLVEDLMDTFPTVRAESLRQGGDVVIRMSREDADELRKCLKGVRETMSNQMRLALSLDHRVLGQ